MSATYSDTPIHQFIKKYIESEGGKVEDVCEEYFTIKTPSLIAPLKYTYKPAIAHEKKVDLIATGTPGFNGMIDDCLKKGALSSVNLKTKAKVEDFIKDFFKDRDYQCEFCEKVSFKDKTKHICTKSPKCYHKINNGKISKIELGNKKEVKLMLFIYGVFFNNKLKKNEEVLQILLDENGNRLTEDLLNDTKPFFEDSKEKINLETFDKNNSIANEIVDRIVKDKKNIFDMQLKKEIDCKLVFLEKKLDDEKLQKNISKKLEFDEKEWKIKKESMLNKEKESLDTFVSIKFLNFLVLNTNRVNFEMKLDNNSVIKSSFLVGIEKNIKIKCPICNNDMPEGYATEDEEYVCFDCVNQSIDTKKIYSKNFKLNKDHTFRECLESDKGFICSVCKNQNSRLFEFICNYDNSKVCCLCFEFCSKCKKLFSNSNLNKSKNTNKLYCPLHIKKCDNCKNFVGIDEIHVCDASGMKVCSCTKFSKCSLCEQGYSTESLKEGKCIACNHLDEKTEIQLVNIIKKHNPKLNNTKKWLIGKNKLNDVLISKGMFSDNLFVIKGDQIVYEKKLGLFNKIKGY